ncbi:hypothetical protein JEQ12_012081 [Ovis aries]|uniref:Uncharacterized protein n=1 Tax=Ovis aries TaxID=9940 RepID=A0A835ZLN1_SHEEP|nr:hypothetical protein JEQ12_012081 [Ovis aries]
MASDRSLRASGKAPSRHAKEKGDDESVGKTWTEISIFYNEIPVAVTNRLDSWRERPVYPVILHAFSSLWFIKMGTKNISLLRKEDGNFLPVPVSKVYAMAAQQPFRAHFLHPHCLSWENWVIKFYLGERKGCGQRGGLTSSPVLGLTRTLSSHPPGLPSASSAGQLCTQEQLGPGAKPWGGHRRTDNGLQFGRTVDEKRKRLEAEQHRTMRSPGRFPLVVLKAYGQSCRLCLSWCVSVGYSCFSGRLLEKHRISDYA